jgi:tetratricopeptide (TPR) repeat protein
MASEVAVPIQTKLRQALALHQQGRLIEAERLYEAVLRDAPDHFDALHLLGVLALQTGRPRRGVDLIAAAIKLKPNVAGVHNNLGNGLKDLGRLTEALASFDAALALRPDYAEAHNNRGIVLQDLRRVDDAVASFDKAIALKQDYAEAYNNRGIALHHLKRLDDALASFDGAIARRPDYAEAHNNRANALKDVKRFDDALASFGKAIALRPDYATAYYNRGIVLQELQRADDALASFDRAIVLRPDYAEAYNHRGIVLQDLGRGTDALASLDRAIALKADYAEAYNNKSLCLLQMGRLEQGLALYEWRKRLDEPFGNRAFAEPLWLGKEDISNKTLFVHWEQGLGDTIQFFRYAKLLTAHGISVELSVQQPLYRLLKQMSSDIKILGPNEVPTEFDCHVPLMSLPLALGTALETIPSGQRYIFADQALSRSWDPRLPPRTKPRIGVVWRGGTKHKNDHNRSIDLLSLAPLFSATAHWISLQKEPRPNEAALLRDLQHIISCGDELADFSDTAAVIDLLDLVITVDTSVAHLAGAMGKPVWILLPHNADWRWLTDRDDSPWYPTARLFRQDETRSWDAVVTRIHAALNDFSQRWR